MCLLGLSFRVATLEGNLVLQLLLQSVEDTRRESDKSKVFPGLSLSMHR